MAIEQGTMNVNEAATLKYYKSISQDAEEPFDWRVGPCAGLTWVEWARSQMGETCIEEAADDDDAESIHSDVDDDAESIHSDVDDDADDDLICPPTPKASTSGYTIKRPIFNSPRRVRFGSIGKLETTEKTVHAQKRPDAPKKAKTRAERRAEDISEDEEDEPSNFSTPQKKERRTAYWALQDDLRIKRAKRERAFMSEDFSHGGAYQFEPVYLGSGWGDFEDLLVAT